MQIEKMLTKTAMRLARAGFGIRSNSPSPEGTAVAETPELRGSGSWANEWAGARGAVERAKSLATAGRRRKAPAKATTNQPADVIPEGTIRTKPLMSIQKLKLHNWIADRLEAEAPTCSLHAGVALHAFLIADTAHEGNDPLCGLVADLMIADEAGQPVMALVRENPADPGRHLMLLDALLDADLPIVDIPNRPSLSKLWAEISANLPTS